MGWFPDLNSIHPGSTPEAPIGLIKKTSTRAFTTAVAAVGFTLTAVAGSIGPVLPLQDTYRRLPVAFIGLPASGGHRQTLFGIIGSEHRGAEENHLLE